VPNFGLTWPKEQYFGFGLDIGFEAKLLASASASGQSVYFGFDFGLGV